MEAQRNADSKRQNEQGSSHQTKSISFHNTKSISSRHTKFSHSRQTQPTSSRKTVDTSSFTPPKESTRTRGKSMTDNLTKFKKFAPPTFKEAKTPAEAEEWLNELEIILEVLKTEEEDKIPFTKFLLRGDAREGWMTEKASHKGVTLS